MSALRISDTVCQIKSRITLFINQWLSVLPSGSITRHRRTQIQPM